MKGRHAVLLLAAFLVAVAVASVDVAGSPARGRTHNSGPVTSRPPKSGPAVRPPAAAPHPSRARRPVHGGARHPSSYWRAERKLVAALRREGRLGAEVRRLRLEKRSWAAQRRLQAASSDPVAAEAHAVIDGLLCVHGGEGAWDDPNAPYYGGIQMDMGFQANYAPPRLRALGTADHWTPLEQLAVGVIGWSLQGHWAPWPQTSRACGLR